MSNWNENEQPNTIGEGPGLGCVVLLFAVAFLVVALGSIAGQVALVASSGGGVVFP